MRSGSPGRYRRSACSPAGVRCHSNRACSRCTGPRQCCRDRPGNVRTGGHMMLGPSRQCCCCTHKASTDSQQPPGCHSNLPHTHRTETRCNRSHRDRQCGWRRGRRGRTLHGSARSRGSPDTDRAGTVDLTPAPGLHSNRQHTVRSAGRPCDPCSPGSIQCRRRTPRHVRCSGKAGRRGSPSDPGSSGHSAGPAHLSGSYKPRCPHHTCRPPSPRRCTHRGGSRPARSRRCWESSGHSAAPSRAACSGRNPRPWCTPS